ncbi:MAG: hypothetical protein ABJB11_10220 [Ferruginibacter sp.]
MPFDVYKCFLPECYLDTTLIEFLLQKSFSVNHKKGNSSIAVTMRNSPLRNMFAVGIIDDDKVKLKELELFNIVERLSKRNLKLFEKPGSHHYFIQICPALEKWILNECVKGGINIADKKYNLPATLKGLINLKGLTQRNDIRFKMLFKDMLENENCDEIRELKRWLLFLKENNYNTNLDLL